MNIDDRLAELKAAEHDVTPPAALEPNVLAAFDARAPRTMGPGAVTSLATRTWFAGAALAAGVLLGAGGSLVYFQRAQPPVIPADAVGESVVFVLDPSGAEETVRVVRIRVARSALESLGIDTVAAQGGDSVDVDVLVGDDGVARGVRLAM